MIGQAAEIWLAFDVRLLLIAYPIHTYIFWSSSKKSGPARTGNFFLTAPTSPVPENLWRAGLLRQAHDFELVRSSGIVCPQEAMQGAEAVSPSFSVDGGSHKTFSVKLRKF